MSKPWPLFKRKGLKKAARRSLRSLPGRVFLGMVRDFACGNAHNATFSLWYMYKDPCTYCGGVADTWDHLLPKSKFREGMRDNKAPACKKCNTRKGPRSILEFLLSEARIRRYCPRGHPKQSGQKSCRVCVASDNRRSALKRLAFQNKVA